VLICKAGAVLFSLPVPRDPALTEWRQRKSPTLDEIVNIHVRAGRGLAAAHDAGLVHRHFDAVPGRRPRRPIARETN